MTTQKTYTENQAIAQVIKMNNSIAKLEDKIESERGAKWMSIAAKNEALKLKINELHAKTEVYKKFITEEGYDNSQLACDMCCSYEDFIG